MCLKCFLYMDDKKWKMQVNNNTINQKQHKMKKTMILLLGALLASVLPGNSLKAQTLRPVSLKVKTLDRTPIASVTIYAYSGNDTLCVDPTDARFTATGALVIADVATLSQPFTNITADSAWTNVSGLSYPRGVVVVTDALNRIYIYSAGDQALRNAGAFTAVDFPDTIVATLSVAELLYRNDPAYATVAKDNKGCFYTTFDAANASAADRSYPYITLTANLPSSINPYTISNPLALFLDTCKVRGVVTVSADSNVYISGSTGSALTILNTSGADTSLITIDGVDSIGFLSCGTDHEWAVQYARISYISITPASKLTIYDGKCNLPDVTALSSKLAPGRFFYNNPDADASSFRWKVATDGYKVTFVNFDAANHDTIIRSEGGLIIPAMARPSYVAPEYLFQHYWKDSVNSTNPWLFDRDSVNRDTILFARWDYYDPTTTNLVRVNHHIQNVDDPTAYTLVDSVEYAVSADTTFASDASRFPGYHDQIALLVVPYTFATADDTTIIDFFYDRNTYTLTWRLNHSGVTGVTCNLPDTIVTMLYGQTIEYPVVTCPGRSFNSWTSNRAGNITYRTMPDGDLILYPVYRNRQPNITWNGPDTVRYSSMNHLSAITAMSYIPAVADSNFMVFYTGDTTYFGDTAFIVTTNTGDTVTEAKYATESPYTIKFRGSAKYLVIERYPVHAVDIEVETVKLYGKPTVITNYGRPDTVLGNDDLFINRNFTASFHDEEPGMNNKVVNVYNITLGGAQKDNYELVENFLNITNTGTILYFGLNNADTLQRGFDVTASGYCVGNSLIEFHIDNAGGATNPDMYSLNFESDRFTDVTSATIDPSGFIQINVPEGTPVGTYRVDVVFWHSAFPTYKSDATTIEFNVKLSKDYIRPIFNDVITIVDTCDCINQESVVWFHNGEEVGSGPYYQQEGGLDGIYFAEFSFLGDDTRHRTCDQTDFTENNYPEEVPATKVSAYPNPTTNSVNIKLENATQFTHTLRVMSVMGVTMLETTFDGDATSIDFSRFGNGSYTVSVDGIVVRVIKK